MYKNETQFLHMSICALGNELSTSQQLVLFWKKLRSFVFFPLGRRKARRRSAQKQNEKY